MKKLISILLVISLFCLAGCKSAPSADDADYATYSSDNGYTVKYPEKYAVSSLGSQIDFVIMDGETGSNVTIMREEKVNSVSDMTEDEFVSRIEKEVYDNISIISFDKTDLNGIPCIVSEFKCNESKVTKVIYDASDNTYTATCTILPGTLSSVSRDFDAVVHGLMV